MLAMAVKRPKFWQQPRNVFMDKGTPRPKARLGLQPFAEDAGSQFVVIWPALREAIVDDDMGGGSPAGYPTLIPER